jgi:hypothetical protein
MPAYLTLPEFKLESTMANSAIDELEVIAPGFVARKLETVSAAIDSRLTKRYEAPFAAPYPLAIVRWLADIVTREAYMKRGVDPNDLAWSTTIEPAATRAETQLTEAANSETGLFELPLRQDLPSSSGATKGGPFGYSEQSPYVGFDVQADAAYTEDRNGRGTDG